MMEMPKSPSRRERGIPEKSEAAGSVLSGVFYFDPADPIYADHFPGCPVVPGSVIVSAFLKAVQAAGTGMRAESVQNFRFRTFLPPGEYEFFMENQGDRLQCRLRAPRNDDNFPLVTGTILLASA